MVKLIRYFKKFGSESKNWLPIFSLQDDRSCFNLRYHKKYFIFYLMPDCVLSVIGDLQD